MYRRKRFNTKIENAAIYEKTIGETKFVIERHFGDRELMELYSEYVVDKITKDKMRGELSNDAA